jgi:large subunit ribosomal protein L17
MRHNKSGRRLGRNSSHRSAMMRNMETSLLDHEKITTTDSRAKELRILAEKMITLGKRGDLHARRQAAQVIQDPKVVAKLFDMVGPRYANRPGGYTRIIKLGSRLGDNASQSQIELVEEEFTARPSKKAPVVKRAEKATPPAVTAEAVSSETPATTGEDEKA